MGAKWYVKGGGCVSPLSKYNFPTVFVYSAPPFMRDEHNILFDCMFAFSGVLDVPCSVSVFFSYESYDLGGPTYPLPFGIFDTAKNGLNMWYERRIAMGFAQIRLNLYKIPRFPHSPS